MTTGLRNRDKLKSSSLYLFWKSILEINLENHIQASTLPQLRLQRCDIAL